MSEVNTPHPLNNIPSSIKSRLGSNLHLKPHHPLAQLKQAIQNYFEAGTDTASPISFKTFDQLSPVVTVQQNFNDLLTPADHVSRRPSDTYYVDDRRLLRCHMTAHQTQLLREGHKAFLMIGDVYRRDEIDARHYPIFHQIDGVRVWQPSELPAAVRDSPQALDDWIIRDLKESLEGMIRAVFGAQVASTVRWIDAYFPFTNPSLEVEIEFEGRWLEVLGAGRIRQEILRSTVPAVSDAAPGDSATSATNEPVGWAFGMGLERLAMVMYGIPDIRLFWSEDPRFLSQFVGSDGKTVKFKPFSAYPACYKDLSFWLPQGAESSFHENDLFEIVRDVAGDLVESVTPQVLQTQFFEFIL
jgi:phenylalanyl-tRNA synthetase alpha chain